MAATADDPEAFLRFARRRDPQVAGDDFLPRALYGDYLQELLETAAGARSGRAPLRRLHGEAVAVSTDEVNGATVVTLGDGTHVKVDRVVLASGFPRPRLPRDIASKLVPPVIRTDPWAPRRGLAANGPLLILGTGLTMVDVACETAARNPGLEIHAISRHGLLPPSQTAFRPDALKNDGGVLAQASGSVRRLVAAVRELAREAERSGGDWREVITLVRRSTPGLWSSLGAPERRRFLRHVRSYWDIHRHRLPGSQVAHLAELQKSGQLVIHAGRVLSLDTARDGAQMTWLPRGASRVSILDAAEVVPCIGPQSDVTRADDRLWKSLLAQGLAVPDELRLGIRTENGALVGRDGSVSDRLFYVGPMLRADYWEATAVAELRVHAEALAQRLLA